MNFACQGLAPPRKRPPFSNAQKAGSRGGFATQSLYRIDFFPRYTRKKTTFEADNCTPKSLSLVSTRFRVRKREKSWIRRVRVLPFSINHFFKNSSPLMVQFAFLGTSIIVLQNPSRVGSL